MYDGQCFYNFFKVYKASSYIMALFELKLENIIDIDCRLSIVRYWCCWKFLDNAIAEYKVTVQLFHEM